LLDLSSLETLNEVETIGAASTLHWKAYFAELSRILFFIYSWLFFIYCKL